MKTIAIATYLKGFEIAFTFDDGKKAVISFKSFLEDSTNPLVRQYLDERKFAKFEVSPFRLHWDNALDVSSEWIYRQIPPPT